MKRFPNLAIGAFFAVLVLFSGRLGDNIHHIRESEAFYRWMLAASVGEDLFKNASTDYKDFTLYEEVRAVAEPLLPEPANEAKREGSKLALVAWERDAEQNPVYDHELFAVARSEALAPARKNFISYAKRNELEFAKNIQYAEAQASGVNLFSLFFGFRKVAANFVWLQVDRYWHMGMMHRMIPLMKTCVVLDPNFVDAYLLGSWHLAYNVTAKMPETPPALKQWHPSYQACVGEKETYYYIAADFLKDGVRNNPRNYKLYFDLGFAVYNEKLHDYPNSVKYLEEAVRQPHERWVPRMLYKALEQNEQYAEAKAGWDDYSKRFPDTPGALLTAQRAIERLGGLEAEQKATKLLEEADALAATDTAKAAELRTQGAAAVTHAREVYSTMLQTAGPTDTFAVGRIAVIDSRVLVREGRFVEAIALLDRARWENANDEYFLEASNLIMDYKQQGKIPLSLSERKAMLRNADGEKCQGQPTA